MPRPLKIGLRVVVSCALAFVFLELGLRTLALFVGGAGDEDALAPRRDGEQIVLCVGDSFTFGMGASDRSGAYPAQLEKRLRAEFGNSWRVVNGAKPGRDSYGILTQLDRQLREYRPDVVCVLVGANDSWRRRGRLPSGPLPEEEDEGGLRTVRLLKLLARGVGLFEDESPAETSDDSSEPEVDLTSHPLVGRWRVVPGDAIATFWPDGEGQIGRARWKWSAVEGGVVFGVVGESPPMTLEKVEDSLVLRPAAGDPLILSPAESLSEAEVGARQLYVRLQEAYATGRYKEADELGDRWLASGEHPRYDELFLLAQLVDTRYQLGREEAAKATLDRMKELHSQSPDRDSSAALGRALLDLGQYEQAYRIARAGLDLPGESLDRLVEVLAGAAHVFLPAEEARPLVEQLLTRVDDLSGEALASLHLRMPKFVHGEERFEAHARAMAEAMRLAPDGLAMEQGLQKGRDMNIGVDRLRRCAIELGLEEDAVERLVRTYVGEPVAESDAWDAVLSEHLSMVIARAEAAGAKVFVPGYPFRREDMQKAQSAAAERAGVPYIEVFQRFPKERSQREAFFVADGHCNDAGYALMADAIAEVLIPALRDK